MGETLYSSKFCALFSYIVEFIRSFYLKLKSNAVSFYSVGLLCKQGVMTNNWLGPLFKYVLRKIRCNSRRPVVVRAYCCSFLASHYFFGCMELNFSKRGELISAFVGSYNQV